jgi:hypothetical protein
VRRPSITAIFAVALLRAHAAPNEIPFEFREGLLWIKATVPQSPDPLNLLVDTGAGVSVLDTRVAERLKLKFGRAVNVRSVETILTGHWLQPLPIKANGIQLPENYLAVDLQKLNQSCASPVDGLLGADFFREKVIQIDFTAQKLVLLTDSPAHNTHTLPLQFRPCGMRIPISVNRRGAQWVRLDTGCASALQWVTSSVHPEDCSRKAAIGLAEILVPQTETTVQIGSLYFEKVPTGVHEKPIFMGEAGLLGNGLLSRFSSITIDAKSGRLILAPTP